MLRNVQHNPLRWYPNAYDRSLNAPKNLEQNKDGRKWTTYDWDTPECGTPKPTARPGHGTLFLCWDGRTRPCDIPAVTKAAKQLKMEVYFVDGDLSDRPTSKSAILDVFTGLAPSCRKDPPGFLLVRNNSRPSFTKQQLPAKFESSRAKTFIGPKTIDIWPLADVFCDAKADDPWYGPMLIAQSRSDVGLKALQDIVANTPPGKAVVIEHASKMVELDLDKELMLRIVTGLGDDSIPETDGHDLMFGDMAGHANSRRELATRFHLYEKDVEVARCHVSYRDGSHKSVIGPTIEMIETAAPHRGRGHLRFLYRHVEEHFFDLWRLRRMPGHFADGNKFGPAGQPGYIMKATYMLERPVERKKSRGDGEGTPVHDKRFLIDCGFQTRKDMGDGRSPLVQSVISRRPADEEMMKFVIKAELPKRSRDIEKMFLCENCNEEGPADKLRKCKRCHCVRYCGVDCQKEDWPFHRLWCNKTSQSIMKKLLEFKLFEINKEDNARIDNTSLFLAGDVPASEIEAVYQALKIAPGDPRRQNP